MLLDYSNFVSNYELKTFTVPDFLNQIVNIWWHLWAYGDK
jgi:hypothetical protein